MQKAANDPIGEQVASGQDVLVEGPAAAARLDAVAAGLEETFNVVRVTAPPGGLGLSGLIAQLSGRERFDEHDDGALETGFRRLCGADSPDRGTVLLLDATQGVQRSVLRYLQQAGRNAPGLRFVIASFAELAGLLEAPDMARLRARLENVVAAEDAEAPGRALMVVPSEAVSDPAPSDPALAAPALAVGDWTAVSRQRASLRQRRRVRRAAVMWTGSAVALAASVAFGAWLGQAGLDRRAGTVRTAANDAAGPDRRAELTLQPVPAHVGAPPEATHVGAPSVAAHVGTPPVAARVGAPPVAAQVGAPPVAARVGTPPELAHVGAPPEAYQVGAPPEAATDAPVAARRSPVAPAPEAAPGGAPASVPAPALAKLTTPEVAAAGEPPEAVKPEPVMTFASVEERLTALAAHSREARRPTAVRPRLAGRTRAPIAGSHYAQNDRDQSDRAQDERPLPDYGVLALPPDDATPAAEPRPGRSRAVREPSGGEYGSDGRESARYGDPNPGAARYQPSGDGPYIGTFSTGPYGARVFRYGP